MTRIVSALKTDFPRGPSAIAREIDQLWPRDLPSRNYADPYINSMSNLVSWSDYDFQESAREIGLRFLCNAGGWRGADAKRIKNEIREALGIALAK